MPTNITEKDAVRLAYAQEIDTTASFLRAGLSVLVMCEKLVVEHLWREMAQRANLNPIELTVPDEEEGGLMPRSLRQRQLATLKNLINALKQGDILVIPHLDLLAGGSDTNLPTESRELIELVYKQAEARRNAPAVLVFDEFDSIATKRSGRDDGGTRAGNALVAQILTEMDGFRPDVPMLVIGTTNRLDIIDEALLRPSRFKAIAINRPDLPARRAIAQVHARNFNIEVSSELIEVIAAETKGMSGDDLRSLFRDACVGLYCEEPPRPANAQRFGELVGIARESDIKVR